VGPPASGPEAPRPEASARPLGPARRAAAWLAAGVAAPALAVAFVARPKWRPGLGERLGRITPGEPGAVWVHGASVGEAAAALRLIDELRRRGHALRASTTSATGRALLASARPELAVSLAPLDHPLCVEAALARARPSALVLVETELWPSWIAGAARRGVPVLVVSGRISDVSLPRYRRLGRWLAPTLGRLAAVGARSEEDARRFAELGVARERISVTGDLKLEPLAPAEPPAELAAALSGAPLLVAGSTHEGEEAGALEAFAAVCDAGFDAALVVAPRHPERFERAARLVASSGRPWRRRSAGGAAPLAPGEVLLLDSLGELSAVYGRARAAFVGGSWAREVGGHNVLEPVFASRPVSFGPSTRNAREAVRIVLEAGAGEVVAGPAELSAAWRRDLAEPEAAAARGAAGRRALAPHEGAARRAADRVEALLGVVAPARAPGAPS